MKKKNRKELKKEDSELPKVSSRKKPYITLTHRLEKSGAEIKISAKSENWLKFRECYIFSSEKLWRDFLPIMEVSYLNSIPKTKHKKGQFKIDALKVFSAILYKFLERIQQTKQYPDSLKRIHKDFRQQKSFNALETAANFMDYALRDYLEKTSFGHAFQDTSCYYKVNIKPFYDGDNDDCNDYENFKNTYIKKGLKIIQKTDFDTLRKLLEEPEKWLRSEKQYYHLSHKNHDNNDILEFLYILAMSVSIEFIDSEDWSIKTYRDKDGTRKPIIEESKFKEISFIRQVLGEIFPALPIPDQQIFLQ